MKQRIWEIDALRGLCIFGMVVVHLLYDLMTGYGFTTLRDNTLFQFALNWGGALFFIISGISATLGRHPVRRGLTVLAGGAVCTAATWLLYALDFAPKSLIIYFGVLHCLGLCMLLWPVFRPLPGWLLLLLGAGLAALGLWLTQSSLPGSWYTMLLGLPPYGFASSDYFPLLPNLGYFLSGSALGKLLYAKKVTLFPKVNSGAPLVAGLRFCGRHALAIYLLHQPVITGFLWLIAFL